MPILLAIFLALSGTAYAHLPHDIVSLLAAPAALDDSGPWFTVCRPGSVDLLMRSDDGGRSWSFVGGPPVADTLLDAARLADGRTVLLGQDELWWTVDGQSWELQAVGSGYTELEAFEGSVLLGGASGLSTIDADGAVQRLSAEPVTAIHTGEGGTVVVTTGGALRTWDGDAWQELSSPTSRRVSSGAMGASAVYAGTNDGKVYRHDGSGWLQCGALPGDATHPQVVGLVAGEGVVAAATADHAALVSLDGCHTWESRVGVQVLYDTEGSATGVDQAFPVLALAGQRIVAGGWAGLSITDDLGDAWRDETLLPPDYARGVAFSPRFSSDHTLWISSYAGGVLWSLDAGASFTGPDQGLSDANVQDVRVDPDNPLRLAAVVGHEAWASSDGGVSWFALNPPMQSVLLARPYARGVWVLGQDEAGEAALAWLGWRRHNWWTPDAGARIGQLSQVVLAQRPTKCVSSRDDGTLQCMSRDKESWITLLDEGPARMTEVVQLPDDRLLVGHGQRLLASEDGGRSWREVLALLHDEVLLLTVAMDGTAVLATRTGRFLVADAEGESWTDLELRLPAAPTAIAPRPDFAQHPQLLAATAAGMFVVDTEQRSLDRFAAVQWIDDHSTYVCPTCTSQPVDGASFGRVLVFDEATVLRTPVRGTEVAIIGSLPGGTALHARLLDAAGAEVEVRDVDTAGPGLAELTRFTGLPDAWYELELTGSPGAMLDVVVATAPWQALDTRPRVTAGAAACASSGQNRTPWAVLLVLLVLPGVGLRRRVRA